MSIENVFYLFLLVVSRNCGDLSLVRVGRKSHIHPSVVKFSLDSLTKEVKERQSRESGEVNIPKTTIHRD